MDPLGDLKKKYPVLEYFKNIEGINEQSLQVLAKQMHLPPKQMTAQCKMILKKIRQFVNKAEVKLKNGRKLYKFLHHSQEFISGIILNNEKLKSIQALEDRKCSGLTQLQLNSNQIEDLTPLQSLLAPMLEEIDLSSNAISIIHSINNTNWKQLNTLNLSQNKIGSIQNIRLGRFQGIKVINLSDNFLTRIRYLRKQLNGNCKELRELDLSFNYISDLRYMSQFNFVNLKLLNLQNNYAVDIFQVEKFNMNKPHSYINYEIRMTTPWQRASQYMYRFRERSRHKLNAKIIKDKYRTNRQTIQKGRRLIFY